eukprot:gene4529-6743_t
MSGSTSSTESSTKDTSDTATSIQRTGRDVILGELPEDFLRLVQWRPIPHAPQNSQSAPYPRAVDAPVDLNSLHGFLRITLIKAKLAKNYGILSMDPYVLFSIGPYQCRSKVVGKGGTDPRWNESLSLPVLPGFSTLSVQIYDMKTLTEDKEIAWAEVDLSEITENQPQEKWHNLSGKQGDGKEGAIHLHIRFERSYAAPPIALPQHYPPLAMLPQHPARMAVPQPIPHTPTADPKLIKQMKDMFPEMSDDVLREVLIATNGNLDMAITKLLDMQ